MTVLTGGPLTGGGVEDQGVEVPLPGEAQADEEEGGPGVHAPPAAPYRVRGGVLLNGQIAHVRFINLQKV